jgi:prevent-host-death family protein
VRTTTITDAKNGLSALLDRVKGGETVLILDRGVPVARLEPVAAMVDVPERLRGLERAGMIRLSAQAPPLDLLRTPGPELRAGASGVAVLLEERQASR